MDTWNGMKLIYNWQSKRKIKRKSNYSIISGYGGPLIREKEVTKNKREYFYGTSQNKKNGLILLRRTIVMEHFPIL